MSDNVAYASTTIFKTDEDGLETRIPWSQRTVAKHRGRYHFKVVDYHGKQYAFARIHFNAKHVREDYGRLVESIEEKLVRYGYRPFIQVTHVENGQEEYYIDLMYRGDEVFERHMINSLVYAVFKFYKLLKLEQCAKRNEDHYTVVNLVMDNMSEEEFNHEFPYGLPE